VRRGRGGRVTFNKMRSVVALGCGVLDCGFVDTNR
jgi:hypothetical protein